MRLGGVFQIGPLAQEQTPMALATYVAATRGVRPDFRHGFDFKLARAAGSGSREPSRDLPDG